MFDKDKKLQEIINSDKLDTTLLLNILINAAKSNSKDMNQIDRMLISKCLQTIEWYSVNKQDLTIKFSKD